MLESGRRCHSWARALVERVRRGMAAKRVAECALVVPMMVVPAALAAERRRWVAAVRSALAALLLRRLGISEAFELEAFELERLVVEWTGDEQAGP